MSPDSDQNHDPFVSIRITEFRNLMTGRFLFVMALRMLSTSIGWWIYELTHDPFSIGLLGLAEIVPALSFALYAGHVIDLSDKKKILLKGVFFYLCCALLLFLLSGNYTSRHLGTHWIVLGIYAVIFCSGIVRAFAGPTFAVLLAYIVPKETLQNATTWNQGTWLSASVSGHAAGGFLIALFGISGSLTAVCILMISAMTVLSLIKSKKPIVNNNDKKTWESVKEGLRFVFKTKVILGAITLDLFAVLFGGAVAMVPVYASDILKVGPQGFGWLNAASDIGAICIVILLTLAPLKRGQGRKLLVAVAGFGCCIILFAYSKWFWLSFAALLISGMLDGISLVIRGTILQLKTPMELRGRVMSVNSMFINSSNELGQFESGLAAKLMGVVPSVVFGGCMTLFIVIATWIKAPGLRKFEY
ncbi:MAG: MFS transporter [Bacteroidetes bacterium]|nr:MFS transporter [Bacteroidota bacterium]MBS1632060.1 MFS transporter [Bacteroidota bacterium]